MHKRGGCKGNEVQELNGSCKEIPFYDVLSDKSKAAPKQPQDFTIQYRVDKGKWSSINITALSSQDATKYFATAIRPGLSGVKVEIKVDPADNINVNPNVNSPGR